MDRLTSSPQMVATQKFNEVQSTSSSHNEVQIYNEQSDPSLGSYDLEEAQANQSDTNNSDEKKELYATLHGPSITGPRCSLYIIYPSSYFKG